MVSGAVFTHERAHARPFTRVRGHVGAGGRRELGHRACAAALLALAPLPRGLAPVVVVDAALALLRLGERNIEVGVEVADGRRPWKSPAHPPLVGLQLRKRRPRDRAERHVMLGQVNRKPVEAVGDHRARGAARRVVGPEHEVIDEQLRAPLEQVGQRGAAFVGLEAVGLVHAHPRQLLALSRQLVAAARQLLLRRQQLKPRGHPLFTCGCLVFSHRSFLSSGG